VELQGGNMLAESHFNFHKAADMLAILRVGRAALSRVHVVQAGQDELRPFRPRR